MFNRYDIGKFKNIDILKNKEKIIKDVITTAVLTILFYVFITKFIKTHQNGKNFLTPF